MVFKSHFEDVKPSEQFKDSLSLFYWHQLDVHAKRTLFVDYLSGRQWTGAEIKQKATAIGQHLLREVNLKPNQSCVFFYPNNDKIQIISLGVLFAGASVCVGSPFDPAAEHCHMIKVMQPAVVFVEPKLEQEMVELRKQNKFSYKICIVNDNQPTSWDKQAYNDLDNFIRMETNLDTPPRSGSSSPSSHISLPVLVGPNEPAYVLLTSGSTGQPKPVARSHRNSLHVCHSLSGQASERLWDLNERSVLSGHIQLDHGTGLFCTKMTLTKGLKLILMDGYEFKTLLTAVERYQITDIMLGSALLHNLASAPKPELDNYNLSSIRNLLSIGSRLPSHSVALQFMSTYPQVSIRQTYGMTEVGFTSFVERARAKEDSETVGMLLPNMSVKVVDLDRPNEEIQEPGCYGEILIAGPTVSPGYLVMDCSEQAAQLKEQSRKVFLDDGYYRTFDVGSMTADGRLIIRGRCNDILCLYDGWKVLPQEIELVLAEHPAVQEAAVVGIPHPELATCHAPRAYVVLKEARRGQVTETELFRWVADRASEPKHLTGGIRILESLPRVSRLSKVNRRELLKMDGFN